MANHNRCFLLFLVIIFYLCSMSEAKTKDLLKVVKDSNNIEPGDSTDNAAVLHTNVKKTPQFTIKITDNFLDGLKSGFATLVISIDAAFDGMLTFSAGKGLKNIEHCQFSASINRLCPITIESNL